ncbi:MAG: hypothetical protein FWF11_00775 [Coriobacteriia bacterium]|nr:hypothetical protein [Coriobacteriia bacterium]
MNPFVLPEQQYGTTLESLLDRRDRVARSEGSTYGSNKMFPRLVQRVLTDVSPDSTVLEIDAGAGLFTQLFLQRGCDVTAFEAAPYLCDLLKQIDNKKLSVHRGFVEDSYPFTGALTPSAAAPAPFDTAVVTFPARRGRGILALICALLPLVQQKILVILPDNGSVDLSSLLRTVSLLGYCVRAEFIVDLSAVEAVQTTQAGRSSGQVELGQTKRAMLVSVQAQPLVKKPLCPSLVVNAWGTTVRVIEVPYPIPRGATTRLIRYFRAGGDRSVLIKTDPAGMNQLYGNMRTAANRIARDQVSVRRVDNGLLLMQVPPNEVAENKARTAGSSSGSSNPEKK